MPTQDGSCGGVAHYVVRIGDDFHHLKSIFTKIFIAAKVSVSKPEDVTKLVRQNTFGNIVWA